MQLAGLDLRRELILELVERLKAIGEVDAAAVLVIADATGEERIGLTVDEREAILIVLDKPSAELEPLRDVLIAERISLKRYGLLKMLAPEADS